MVYIMTGETSNLGNGDADGSSHRCRKETILRLVNEMENSESGALVNAVLDSAEEEGIDRRDATGEIDRLQKVGWLYQLRDEHLRVT